MRKLYFLAPDALSARNIIIELRDQGVYSQHISILANQDTQFDSKLEVTELNSENLSNFDELGKSDLLPALEKGAAMGGSLGLIGGLAALAFPPAGLVIGGGAVLASTTLGAGLGAWISSMIGISAPHHDIEEYVSAIESGSVLLLVDVDEEKLESIKGIIASHHPEADIKQAGKLMPGPG